MDLSLGQEKPGGKTGQVGVTVVVVGIKVGGRNVGDVGKPYGGGRTVTPAVTSLRGGDLGVQGGRFISLGGGFQCNGKIRGRKK